MRMIRIEYHQIYDYSQKSTFQVTRIEKCVKYRSRHKAQ